MTDDNKNLSGGTERTSILSQSVGQQQGPGGQQGPGSGQQDPGSQQGDTGTTRPGPPPEGGRGPGSKSGSQGTADTSIQDEETTTS
jgi:hypothetical protein